MTVVKLAHLPTALHNQVQHYWEDFNVAVKTHCKSSKTKLNSKQQQAISTLWALSHYAAKLCIQQPNLLFELLHSGDLYKNYRAQGYKRKLQQQIQHCENIASLSQPLRQFRHREMLRIIWRDLVLQEPLTTTLSDMTQLAEACVQLTHHKAHEYLQQRYGEPCDKQGNPQSLLILALGKLGAQELNLSSDIDLIFIYPKIGKTCGTRSLNNEVYFSKLAQHIVKVLSEVTSSGFVFRVDLRLRPYGSNGPLVMDLLATERYYQDQGRTWERYALLRARLIVGAGPAATQLQHIVHRFVYRRYVDYSVIHALRDMKLRISQASRNNELSYDIKRGSGGIRELEFIVQVFQLIRGGQLQALQQYPLLKILPQLVKTKTLSKDIVATLIAAYQFLRKLEHRLQAVADLQTHRLPDDPKAQVALAFAMGYTQWSMLLTTLSTHQQHIQNHFSKTIATPKYDHVYHGAQEEFKALWLQTLHKEEANQVLVKHGYSDPDKTLNMLTSLRTSKACTMLTNTARRRLDSVMPLLLACAAQSNRAHLTLTRAIKVIEAILGRSVYLSLLLENPRALEQLVKLCTASHWVSEHIAKYPLLLDELLHSQRLYQSFTAAELPHELQHELVGLAMHDTEEQMACLCRFKQTQVLRVAAGDVMHLLPLTQVSEHLNNLAVTIINQTCKMAWQNLSEKYGSPEHTDEHNSGFAIIAYGKLGSGELSYSSDLDLVFLYDDGVVEQQTTGRTPISIPVFYARLAQRVVHLLNTQTTSGVLYQVDTRLRPSGTAGLLVTPLSAFAHYQCNKAWTWEHQALVRARCIYGHTQLKEKFNAIRKQVLTQIRPLASLNADIIDMRKKMLASATKLPHFDIKQDSGGMVDIEFIVQYCVLRWAHEHWDTLQDTNTLKLLTHLAHCHLLTNMDANILIDAYRYYRKRLHTITLQNSSDTNPSNECLQHRQSVQSVWKKLQTDGV